MIFNNHLFLLLFVFILGLCLGSFANVLIFRIPKNLSIIKPGSTCPSCKNTIKWFHNIPVISYILLKGKCGYCGTKISLQYPLIEIFTAFSFLLIFIKSNTITEFLFISVFVYILIVISVIDYYYFIIPDFFSISLIPLGILFSIFNKTFEDSIMVQISNSVLGAVFGFLLLILISFVGKIIFKKEAMGLGDTKLMSGIGAFLGVKGVILTLFLGSLSATMTSIVLIYIMKTKKWNDYIPFGPFLSLGSFLTVFLCYLL
ncbi:MAG: hypothetical protein A2252_03295 [Elusimicrobia bacterium RIFOXYA2_FULL_39_19]|nr:MAG: hypothetical protein A2252_03295 [Elusimicrobia bacterium RIFOXYA2_FULL_39_19]